MLGICIESSHSRGMGHLFRALNFARLLESRKLNFVILINEDIPSIRILEKEGVRFKLVPLNDAGQDWEGKVIEEFGLKTWINDRLDTTLEHARKVHRKGIRLVTFDDRGAGAALSDLHIAGLAFEGSDLLGGKRVLSGIDYLIMNQEINRFKRHRTATDKVLVTLGGTDTYGVTIDIVAMLTALGRPATVVVGPGFQHHEQLKAIQTPEIQLAEGVASLVAKFHGYDLAITGGGITPFEANASGLPCITVSSERFEVGPCEFLQNLGTSIYLGPRESLDRLRLEDVFRRIDVARISQLGMERVGTNGAQRILDEINKL